MSTEKQVSASEFHPSNYTDQTFLWKYHSTSLCAFTHLFSFKPPILYFAKKLDFLSQRVAIEPLVHGESVFFSTLILPTQRTFQAV